MADVSRLTPVGAGGIAVLSVDGPEAWERLRSLTKLDRRPSAGSVKLVRLANDGDDLDEALLVTRAGDRVELHVHGSPALVAELERLLGDGEAASRDRSLEARAWSLLGDAPSELGARVLLSAACGALRRELEALQSGAAPEATDRLQQLIERGEQARHFLRPTRVVLAGPVNAGKSTLFNALVGRERVLVSPEAGTTRDAISERTHWDGLPIDLIDTAGERALDPRGAAERVEQLGQELGQRVRAGADVVLWLVPCDAPASKPPNESMVVVRTCADRGAPRAEALCVSALRAPDDARRTIAQAVRATLQLPERLAWTPDAGVPFANDDIELLATCRVARHGERTAILRSLLADV